MAEEMPKPMTVRDRLKSVTKAKRKPKSQDKRVPKAIGKKSGNRANW